MNPGHCWCGRKATGISGGVWVCDDHQAKGEVMASVKRYTLTDQDSMSDDVLVDYVLASDYDSLVDQIIQQTEDECEEDTAIRDIARPILGAALVDGDSYGVPLLREVVALLATKYKALIGEGGEEGK